MNFRTESLDLPQNEQRKCLSCDMAVPETGDAAPGEEPGRGRLPRVNIAPTAGQARIAHAARDARRRARARRRVTLDTRSRVRASRSRRASGAQPKAARAPRV